jgi:peptidoglycan/LPS O-acetylase OafA/YrhL
MQIRYRPEIDGLRTIAVLAVIIYHAQLVFAGETFLKGGFLGVDIFFVISGFLITSIIMKELHAEGRFSFLDFYERRARRILPALFLVILTGLPVAWYLLLPNQLIDFSKSILGTLFFGSNFYWNGSLQEYGAESALLKPFLHTWSLAVEEQYYIVFPIILIALYKWYKNYTVVLLTAGLLLSLGLSDFITARNQSFSFYMLPTRFWELLAGSLLANIFYFHPQRDNDAFLNKTMPVFGLYLIGYALIFVEFDNNHPGYVTLLPVVGTFLIIWFANEKDLVTKMLSSRIFVGIGLISYSLYLWHYPIFAFGRMVNASPAWQDKLVWVVLTFVLSIVTYFFVEKPFRNRTKISRKKLLVYLASAAVLIFAVSYFSIVNKGFISRLPPILSNLETNVLKSRLCEDSLSCSFNQDSDKSIFLVGDSHMMPLEQPLADFANKNAFKFTVINQSGCQYILNMNRVSKKDGKVGKCNTDIQQKKRDILTSAEKSVVIIGGRLPLMLSEERFNNQEGGDEGFIEGNMTDVLQYPDNVLATKEARNEAIAKEYRDTVLELAEYGHKVVLIYPVPEVGWNVPKKLMHALGVLSVEQFSDYLSANQITTSYPLYRERTAVSFKLLDSIQHENVYRVYPHKLFCNTSVEGRCITHDTENSFYRDDDHLSQVGARMLTDEIINLPFLKAP